MIGLLSRTSSNEHTLENMDAETKAEFNVFEDYLGLIKLVCPPRSSSSCESLMSSMFDFPRGERGERQRINSLDSDGLSDSSSSSGGRDFDMIYDSMSCNSDFPSYPSIPSPPMSVTNEPITSTTLNPSLEAFWACQKNVLSRLQPVMLKETRNSKSANKATVCVFCRNNGESREFYSSHTLKDVDGKTSCPILRAYTCPLCKANGDNSHTIKYCPKYTPKVKAEKLLAVGITL